MSIYEMEKRIFVHYELFFKKKKNYEKGLALQMLNHLNSYKQIFLFFEKKLHISNNQVISSLQKQVINGLTYFS